MKKFFKYWRELVTLLFRPSSEFIISKIVASEEEMCYPKFMESKFLNYINQLMKKAHYEYDASVKEWAGWIGGFPGVYAQGKSVEEVRSELMSAVEDYLLVDLKRGRKIPGFSISPRQYAKTR